MFAIITGVITTVMTRMFTAVVTDKVLIVVVLRLLETLAAKTTNTIDDDVLAIVRQNINNEA